jgi:transcriptional regulator NrdR family protein
MKCPECAKTNSLVSGGGSKTKVHEAMGQIVRYRFCPDCDCKWTTIELPEVELQRIRSLAHATVMAGVKR